jgi:predicted aspartyl protease
MRKGSIIVVCLAGALLAAGAGGEEPEKCTLGRYATLPISIDEVGLVTVPMKIGGLDHNLLVDTGGAFSMLTEAATARLGLKPKALPMGAAMFGWGGRKLDHYVVAPTLEIAGAIVPNREFMLIPDDFIPLDDDGILAPDILAIFDVDFDFANSRLGLYSQKHCEGKVVYWTHDDYAVIPFKLDEARHMQIVVTLDGKEVPAILDTGASDTVMSLEEAESVFDIAPSAIKPDVQYPFKTLSLQGVTVNNPNIHLVPDDRSKMMGGYGQPTLILGMGVLRQLHLWIAFKEHNIYVTPASAH